MTRTALGIFVAAAILGAAAPGRGQSPAVPSSPDDPSSKMLGWVEPAPNPPAGSSRAAMPSEPVGRNPAASLHRGHRRFRSAYRSGRRRLGSDRVANELNRQELARARTAARPASETFAPQAPQYPWRGSSR